MQLWFIMVNEPSEVQFGLKSYAWFWIRASLIWNHKYDFRTKLYDVKFNYQFITAILKLQNSVST